MGRIMSFGQDGRMVRDFDKSEHDFMRRYGKTPEEVMVENAKLRELVDELYPLADYGSMDASELDRAHDLMRDAGIEVPE